MDSNIGIIKHKYEHRDTIKNKAFRSINNKKNHKADDKKRDLSVKSVDAWDEYNNSATYDSLSQKKFINRPNKGSWQN